MDIENSLPSLNSAAQRHLERIQDKVKYCITCQPYDGGDYVWILGEETTLEDIFVDLNVPEKYRDDIAEHIFCPNCGAANFERYDTVGLEDKYDKKVKEHIDFAVKKHGKKLEHFQLFIEKYPLLALSLPLGRKIYKEIIEKQVPSEKISGKWFRSRNVKNYKVFDNCDMGAPNVGIAGEGRYHHSGQSVLYLANHLEVAVSEVVEDLNIPSLVWVQEYEVDEIDNILDLRGNWEDLGPSTSTIITAILNENILERKVSDRNSKWKPEYFITRFIADCAKLAEFNGILYRSTRSFGDNVVLFKWDKSKIKEIGKPRVLVYEPQNKDNFLSFDF